MSRVGIIQSAYMPWRGYFDFIRSVDLFLLFDDVQYPRGRSWRNRNQVKTESGLKWLTIPVPARSYLKAIDEVTIPEASASPWREEHRKTLQRAFRGAPFAAHALALWDEAISANDATLSALNARLIAAICRYLSITTPIEPSRKFGVSGRATERLIGLLRAVGARTYLSGPVARDYLDEEAFRANNLRLEYKSYDYASYPQLWGAFEGSVTVLDLIANVGPGATRYLESRSPNVVAVG